MRACWHSNLSLLLEWKTTQSPGVSDLILGLGHNPVSILILVLVMDLVLVLVSVLVSALVLGQTVGRQDAIDQGWCHNHHNWRPLSQAVLSLAQHRTRNGPHLNSPNVFIQTNLSYYFSHFYPKLELWSVSFLEGGDLKFRFYSEQLASNWPQIISILGSWYIYTKLGLIIL